VIRWTDTSPRIEWPVHSNAIELLKSSRSNAPLVLVTAQTVANVLSHLQTPPAGLKTWFSGMPIEQGGLLIGRVTRLNETTSSDQFECIEVLRHSPAPDATGTALSLRMESSVWQAANEVCDELNKRLSLDQNQHRCGPCRVIGWYHSHPNLGAFFSGTDRQTQAAFFNHDYSLGWVIDPVRSTSLQELDQAWYIGAQSVETVATIINDRPVEPSLPTD
jgi:proteasome lid subunit RPN8/RPN11